MELDTTDLEIEVLIYHIGKEFIWFGDAPNQMNSAGIDSGIRPSQLSHNKIRRPSLRKRVSQDSLGSPEHGYNDSLDTNESHELKSYDSLIRSMLVELQSCKSKLEASRHDRIKNGVLFILEK
ncbi:hypothetical protein PENSTE_c010G04410 [Penicillium steckii]|uniref:Uncharacterized protein n=1 Tax=Penicillium steckii TaxID=303698 RepID=A0A1V6T7V1_9EURO|nr:hypothetical protein PENSTE_c010G04410 [Penicillium steckii]